MSATVTIRKKGLFGKTLTLADIVPEELSYGIGDECQRLDEGKEGDYTIIFDPENIGRGFDISFDGTTVEMHLNYPNSRHDIELFYMMVSRVCGLQGAKTFLYEDEKHDLSEIERLIQQDIDASRSGLRSAMTMFEEEGNHLTIFGVMHPLVMGEKEIAEIGDDIDKFGQWLNEKQQLDAYYAAPHFYQKQDGTLFGSYAIGAGIASIVPTTPEKPLFADKDMTVDHWYVLLGNSDESKRKNDGIRAIPYDKMIESVQKSEYYDADHIVVELTDEEVDEMVEQYRVEI